MSKQCIFCQKEFTQAPPEHVIPKSIGGQFTIHSVCASCNSNLNKKIDEKFKDHKLISTYRFAFSTNGRGKGIKNPLSGERINIEGTKYNLKLNDDLTVDATMSPKFSKQFSDLKIGDTIEIQIDEKQIGHIEGYKENIAKRLGISIDEIQIQNIDKTFRPESNYILKTDNNIVLLEFSKIFFQTASDLIGEPYLNDPIAAKYRSMLISGKIDESIKEYISPNNQITAEVFLQLLPSAQNCPNKHLIILSGYIGVGLVGFIKIYNSYHVQILSTSSDFYQTGMKIITNDFKNNKLNICEPNKVPTCDVKIDPIHVIDHITILDKEFEKNAMSTDYPVLNSNKQIITKSLFELINNFNYPRSINSDFETNMIITIFFNDVIFIQPKSIKILVPIQSIDFNFSIATIKERGG